MTNDHINIKDITAGNVRKTEKLLIQTITRELHYALINPPSEVGFSGARSESGDVIILYLSLSRYMPHQVKFWQLLKGDA